MPASVDKRDVARLRKRSVFLSLAGVIPLSLFVQWSDLVVGGTMAAGPFPPLAACLFWAVLILVNWLFGRISRSKPPLFPSELLIIFAVWASATMVAGRGLTHALLSSLAGPAYYARTGLAAASIRRHLPDWLAISDRNVAVRFYEGGPGGVDWGAWAPPLLTWSLFFLSFLIANISLCALFERMWIREERLTFPLVNLPVGTIEITFRTSKCEGVSSSSAGRRHDSVVVAYRHRAGERAHVSAGTCPAINTNFSVISYAITTGTRGAIFLAISCIA